MARGSDDDPAKASGATPRGSPIPQDEATSHDTEADARWRRRAPLAPPPPAEQDAESEPSASVPSAETAPPKVRLPAGRARLSAVRVHEAATRRRFDAARVSRDPRAPHACQTAPPLVELTFVRVLDRTQRAFAVGGDGVRVVGEATGEDHRGRRATVTVGLADGAAYTAVVPPRASAARTAAALARRVAGAFEVEVHREGESASFIRFVRSAHGG